MQTGLTYTPFSCRRRPQTTGAAWRHALPLPSAVHAAPQHSIILRQQGRAQNVPSSPYYQQVLSKLHNSNIILQLSSGLSRRRNFKKAQKQVLITTVISPKESIRSQRVKSKAAVQWRIQDFRMGGGRTFQTTGCPQRPIIMSSISASQSIFALKIVNRSAISS